jgi:hypothetical protein
VKGGTYAAARQLVRAVDQLRVLASVARDTEADHAAVRDALSMWDGMRPRRRGRPQNPEPTSAGFETTIGRYITTGVWR